MSTVFFLDARDFICKRHSLHTSRLVRPGAKRNPAAMFLYMFMGSALTTGTSNWVLGPEPTPGTMSGLLVHK